MIWSVVWKVEMRWTKYLFYVSNNSSLSAASTVWSIWMGKNMLSWTLSDAKVKTIWNVQSSKCRTYLYGFEVQLVLNLCWESFPSTFQTRTFSFLSLPILRIPFLLPHTLFILCYARLFGKTFVSCFCLLNKSRAHSLFSRSYHFLTSSDPAYSPSLDWLCVLGPHYSFLISPVGFHSPKSPLPLSDALFFSSQTFFPFFFFLPFLQYAKRLVTRGAGQSENWPDDSRLFVSSEASKHS